MEEFFDAFQEVFDNDLKIKACGRVATIRLIKSAEALKSGVDFGDLNTGKMNIGNIIALYNEVV